tara:strand:- start:4502 stop:4909 length:408 start_codon:yes stop_codon:yes gene_type:complete
MGCAKFTFTGTPILNNPLTPVLVGSSTSFTPTISSNEIQLPAGEYVLRFYGAITRASTSANILYQWREVGGSLLGKVGATNREIAPGTYAESLDSADARLELTSSGSVQIEMTQVDAGVTLDTTNTHAVIWRVPV